MIKVKELYYKYPHSSENVLQNINFELHSGEIIAIVGQNGSGKSTLGKLLAGIIKVKKDHILIDDLDIAKSKNHYSTFEKVGIVFQNPENQIIFNNVYDEINFSLRGGRSHEEKITEALQKVGMEQYLHADLSNFSLGQKQRIVLAEMLARNPQYLILDEPTAMLDSVGKKSISRIIKQLRAQNVGIFLITNVAEELFLADRILILDHGMIVAEIIASELINQIPILEKYHIALPDLMQLANHLQKAGMQFRRLVWSPQKIAEEILHASH